MTRAAISLRREAPVILSVLIVASTWEVVGRTADLFVVPPLTDIAAAFFELLLDGVFWSVLPVSLATLAIGMVIAIVVGVAVGTLMGLFRTVEYALDVYVNAGMAAPVIAFVPVFILLFGLGPESRIATVFVFAVWVIIVNTYTGIRTADQALVEMGRSFGASGFTLFREIRLPAAFPYVLAGIRVGTARGIKGLINGEVLIAIVGLGGLVQRYGTVFSMDSLYAVIAFIIILALTTVALVDWLSRRLVRTAPEGLS